MVQALRAVREEAEHGSHGLIVNKGAVMQFQTSHNYAGMFFILHTTIMFCPFGSRTASLTPADVMPVVFPLLNKPLILCLWLLLSNCA